MVPHAAGVGVASVLHQECSGLRTPLSKTWPWAQLQFYLKGSCFFPPPAALAPCLGARALVGGRGRPLLFCPSFSPVFLPSS